MHRRTTTRGARARVKAHGSGNRDSDNNSGAFTLIPKLLLPPELLSNQGSEALVLVPPSIAVLRQHAKHARQQRLLHASQRCPLTLEPSRYALENLPAGFLSAAKFVVIRGQQPASATRAEAKALAAEWAARKGEEQPGSTAEGLEVPLCVVPSLGVLRNAQQQHQRRWQGKAPVPAAAAAAVLEPDEEQSGGDEHEHLVPMDDEGSDDGDDGGGGSSAGKAVQSPTQSSPGGSQPLTLAAAVAAQAPVRRMGGKEGRLLSVPPRSPVPAPHQQFKSLAQEPAAATEHAAASDNHAASGACPSRSADSGRRSAARPQEQRPHEPQPQPATARGPARHASAAPAVGAGGAISNEAGSDDEGSDLLVPSTHLLFSGSIQDMLLAPIPRVHSLQAERSAPVPGASVTAGGQLAAAGVTPGAKHAAGLNGVTPRSFWPQPLPSSQSLPCSSAHHSSPWLQHQEHRPHHWPPRMIPACQPNGHASATHHVPHPHTCPPAGQRLDPGTSLGGASGAAVIPHTYYAPRYPPSCMEADRPGAWQPATWGATPQIDSPQGYPCGAAHYQQHPQHAQQQQQQQQQHFAGHPLPAAQQQQGDVFKAPGVSQAQDATPGPLRPWDPSITGGDRGLSELLRLTCSVRAAAAAAAAQQLPPQELQQRLSAALPFLAARRMPLKALELSGIADVTLQGAKAVKASEAPPFAAASGQFPTAAGPAVGQGLPSSPRPPFSPLGLGPPSPVVLGGHAAGRVGMRAPEVQDLVNQARSLWGAWGRSIATAVLDSETGVSPTASASARSPQPRAQFYFGPQVPGEPESSGSEDGEGAQPPPTAVWQAPGRSSGAAENPRGQSMAAPVGGGLTAGVAGPSCHAGAARDRPDAHAHMHHGNGNGHACFTSPSDQRVATLHPGRSAVYVMPTSPKASTSRSSLPSKQQRRIEGTEGWQGGGGVSQGMSAGLGDSQETQSEGQDAEAVWEVDEGCVMGRKRKLRSSGTARRTASRKT